MTRKTCTIERHLQDHLHDPSSSFSIGSFGAIAEFHRDTDETLCIDDAENLTIGTRRGAMRIDLCDDIVPVAYEALSRRRERWQQGVVFCLPRRTATSRQRTVLTELGPDRQAIRAADRDAILFDTGLDARNVDFCIRTSDPDLLSRLRQFAGRSILDPDSGAMGTIIAADPHRIAISRLGRIEVYQGIGRDKTPEGPHTHVLPRFLKSRRTHSANIPVPAGHLPCLSLYPANPLMTALGRGTPFDAQKFDAFEDLIKAWGSEAYRAEKSRVRAAMDDGMDPERYARPETRLGRTALRITVRQARQTRPNDPIVSTWCDQFDRTRD
ncbi:MAG: hypothetical protein AAF563_21925 [Pseudomonadota bacterium]